VVSTECDEDACGKEDCRPEAVKEFHAV